jgi:hypothetical protein
MNYGFEWVIPRTIVLSFGSFKQITAFTNYNA